MREYLNLFEAKDVDGDVDLSDQNLTKIPEQYGIAGGSFWCDSNQLTTLEGAPEEVGRDFWCQTNQLITLEGGPKKVDGDFWCQRNRLTSLKGAPKKVGRDFLCNENQLNTLEGAPEEVGGSFWCQKNPLTSLKGTPKKVGKNFLCSENPDLSPWEMRYALFCDIKDGFKSNNEEADALINEFFKRARDGEEKQDIVVEYMERLKKLS